MRNLITICSLVIFAVSSTVASSSKTAVAFTHVNVIDATGTPAQPDMAVIIEGQRITAVRKEGRVRVPQNAQVIDARGKYLIPGLWDMHVHEIFGDWLPRNED